MKKRVFLTFLCFSGVIFANNINKPPANINKNIIQKDSKTAVNIELKKINDAKQKINKSTDKKYILLTIQNMGETLFYLKNKDKIRAEEKLKYALSLLKHFNKKKYIPVDNKAIILEFKGNVNDAKKLISNAQKNINQKAYQLASYNLNLLKDELDLINISVNIDNLKKQIKETLQLVENNELDKAFKKLALIFKNKKTIDKNFFIYPLGVIKAVYFINHAKIINQMKNKTEKDCKNIITLLKEAKKELLLDKTMGYFYKTELQKEYIYLINMLNEIQEDTLKYKESDKYQKINKILKNIKEKSVTKRKNPKNELFSE